MKTYKLLKYQDKGKGTMELKSEVPDFKKNKKQYFYRSIYWRKKNLIETKYFKNNSNYIVQGKN